MIISGTNVSNELTSIFLRIVGHTIIERRSRVVMPGRGKEVHTQLYILTYMHTYLSKYNYHIFVSNAGKDQLSEDLIVLCIFHSFLKVSN